MPLHDHAGNVRVLVDETGTAGKTYRYSAFGEELELDASDANPWRFSSKHFDVETGFVYFGHRYYDPVYARWTTPDPAEYVDGPNRHAYLRNNPLIRFDPYGLWGEGFWEGGLSFGQSFGSAAYDMGCNVGSNVYNNFCDASEWIGADFEYEYGNDTSLFNSKMDTCTPINPFELATSLACPGFLDVYNLDANASFSDKAYAYGHAAFDVALLASGTAGVRALANTGKAISRVEGVAAASSVASKVSKGVGLGVREGAALSRGAESANASVNLSKKLSQLESASQSAFKVRNLPDGRIRYYDLEIAAQKLGPTRGRSYTTEFNPVNNRVRTWMECYDHSGKVNRVHPKQLNGQELISRHYPHTARELGL